MLVLRQLMEDGMSRSQGLLEGVEGEASLSLTFYDLGINRQICHDPSMHNYPNTDPHVHHKEPLSPQVRKLLHPSSATGLGLL